MSQDINMVVLLGRLVRDAQLRYTSGGTAVANLSMAVNRRKKEGDSWREEASFFDIQLWGKAAESLERYLTKGKQIAVQGELRQSRWQQDGQNRSKVSIAATNLQLLSSGKTEKPQASQHQDTPSRPRTHAEFSGVGQNQESQRANSPQQGPEFFDDDIPF
jgi:single-strand DNA-binding protein